MNKYFMQKVIMLTVLSFGLILASVFQATAQTKSIAGDWDASMESPGGVRTFKVVFKVEGEKLTGTVKRSSGDVPLEGTVKGNDVQFAYTIKYNENDLTLMVSGKLDGDTITGTVTFGESGQQAGWSAKRAPEPKPSEGEKRF